MRHFMSGLAVVVLFCSGCMQHGSPAQAEDAAPTSKHEQNVAGQPQKLKTDWLRFRGPNGAGFANAKGLPTEWSATKNLVWKTKLPGSGSSSPIIIGNRVYVTCYSGYGLDKKNPGKPQDLKRHLLCIDSDTGRIVWDKSISKNRRISHFTGFMHLHGYASSTPTSDGERIYVYFGTWGAAAFDLKGKQLWHADCGERTHGFGSGASPILHGDLLIVNASVESGRLFAFNKGTGQEVWRADNIRDAWNTPILVESDGKTQVVLATQPAIKAFDAKTGQSLWQYQGSTRNTYVCPSLVTDGDKIYSMPSYYGPVVAVAANGKEVWKSPDRFRTTVVSPVLHQGHIYYPDDGGGRLACFEARTGALKKLLSVRGRQPIYASPLIADGKLYVVTRRGGTFVYSATPKLQRLAHNTFADDDSQFNASPVPLGRHLLLRSEKYLYCVGTK